VVGGTATTGADLDNLDGAAAVPDNAVLLANVLVGAAATTITDAEIDTLARPRARIDGAVRGPSLYDIEHTESDIVSTASEVAAYQKLIRGGDLGTDRTLRLFMAGDYLNNSGANRTFVLQVKLGGTVLFGDTSVSIPANATRRPWRLDLDLGNIDDDAIQHLSGAFFMGSPSTGGVAGLGDMNAASLTVNSVFSSAESNPAVDTSADVLLEVTITHSTSNASLSFRTKLARLQIV
jgi:hypothetical protein